jgi:hypothetical protein
VTEKKVVSRPKAVATMVLPPESNGHTIEEVVMVIYEYWFEGDGDGRKPQYINRVVEHARGVTGESRQFIQYCIGKMILSGISFVRE